MLAIGPLTLASGSPRRKALLEELGLTFDVFTRAVDEELPEGMAAEEAAEFLARKKASAYADLAQSRLVLTADTVVVLDGEVLGKPADADEARRMLRALSGREHRVISGVCLFGPGGRASFSETTRVFFRELSGGEIAHYVDVYQPFDKAGAYGIQEWIGRVGVERIEGDYCNVMGLPVVKVYRALADFTAVHPCSDDDRA